VTDAAKAGIEYRNNGNGIGVINCLKSKRIFCLAFGEVFAVDSSLSMGDPY
jgi:hypothetical protein